MTEFDNALSRLTARYDDAGANMVDFVQRSADGEEPDPEAFVQMLKTRGVTASAMQAQYTLLQKPLHIVLAEAK